MNANSKWDTPPGDIFQARTKLFEQLIRYFPRDMQEPRELLIDAVKIGQNC